MASRPGTPVVGRTTLDPKPSASTDGGERCGSGYLWRTKAVLGGTEGTDDSGDPRTEPRYRASFPAFVCCSMKSSVICRAMSSGYWTGGDFMK